MNLDVPACGVSMFSGREISAQITGYGIGV